MKICFTICALIGVMGLHAEINFIDNKLEDFAGRFFDDKQEAVLFVQYYAGLQQKSAALSRDEYKNLERYLHSIGLEGVKSDHPDWYASIAPIVTDPGLTLDKELNQPREIIAAFLHRYGAYQEFIKRRPGLGLTSHQQHEGRGFFAQVTEKIAEIGNKIAGWFGPRAAA